MSHAVTWFEIPATNLDRAVAFYERTLGRPLQREVFRETKMAMFVPAETPAGQLGEVGGALVEKSERPQGDGVLVYLNAERDIDGVLARVTAAGGTIVLPKQNIAPHGFIAHVRDSEGNLIGLHAEA